MKKTVGLILLGVALLALKRGAGKVLGVAAPAAEKLPELAWETEPLPDGSTLWSPPAGADPEAAEWIEHPDGSFELAPKVGDIRQTDLGIDQQYIGGMGWVFVSDPGGREVGWAYTPVTVTLV